jgi:hypothetical protein
MGVFKGLFGTTGLHPHAENALILRADFETAGGALITELFEGLTLFLCIRGDKLGACVFGFIIQGFGDGASETHTEAIFPFFDYFLLVFERIGTSFNL